MTNGWHRVAGLVMLVGLMGATGCCNHESHAYPVEVKLDPSFGGTPRIEVHLVGVSDTENPSWENYSMTNYWKAGDLKRETAVKRQVAYVMSFGAGQPTTQVLAADNPIWKRWIEGGAKRLYVLAFLPGAFADAPGESDPRRRILTLDKCLWPDGEKQTIRVSLLPSNVQVDTNPVKGK